MNLHDTPPHPEDEKQNAGPAELESTQNSQASSSKQAASKEATETYDIFGIQANFFQKFQSPEKQKETKETCTEIVPYQAPESSNKAMEQGTTRPALRRQLARSNFSLDDSDLSTLALALQTKTLDNEHPKDENALATPSPMKRKRKLKPKAKAKQLATKESPRAKQSPKEKGSPKAMKSTFRHRKTSSAYHSAKAAAQRAGYSPTTVKAKAKAASQAVAGQIDAGILKE